MFSDEQLGEFFEKLDAGISVTETFPYNDIVFPVMLRVIYCCGLRSSEAWDIRWERYRSCKFSRRSWRTGY